MTVTVTDQSHCHRHLSYAAKLTSVPVAGTIDQGHPLRCDVSHASCSVALATIAIGDHHLVTDFEVMKDPLSSVYHCCRALRLCLTVRGS